MAYFSLYYSYTSSNAIKSLYSLLLFAAKQDILIKLHWIKGKDNILANTLSHFKYDIIANIYLYQ
jgi:hypothetical protein